MFNLHVALLVKLNKTLIMLITCIFVLVVEIQKLEVCIHKQNYMTPIQFMVLKLSEN